jgi:lysophospholipase L1-like esterase
MYDIHMIIPRHSSVLALGLMVTVWLAAQAITPAERQRFEEIKARHDRGEAVSAEEQRFAMDIMARQRQAGAAQQNADYAKTHPPRESTGLVPLPDLGAGSYQGEQGGLYPGGQNVPPESHLKAGLALARQIVPVDAEGRASDNGRIVFLTIGMSNTTQESQAFIRLAHADTGLNPKLVLVDGAQGAQTARITANPEANFWKVVGERLAAVGVTAKQVEVAWIKQANAGPTAPFPAEVKKLQADLVATLHNLHDQFPNLKIAYLSSRIYAGYAAVPLNPEPHAYEGGFAVKWTIADQINGAPGAVRAPWIAWGPYLWADGTNGRKQDNLVYTREDVGPDGTHPSAAGQRKVGQLLLDFLKSDATARPWFVR